MKKKRSYSPAIIVLTTVKCILASEIRKAICNIFDKNFMAWKKLVLYIHCCELFSILLATVLEGKYGTGPHVDRARLLVSNCWVKNSWSFIPILMRSGVVDLEIMTWKISHFKSPWTNISLEYKINNVFHEFIMLY